MWPFKSKPVPLPAQGQLQTDLAAMELSSGSIALMFEVPDENDSCYWVVDDPETLHAIANGQFAVNPSDFFASVNRVENADPFMPELVWLLKDRELDAAYNFTAETDFPTHVRAQDLIKNLGPNARPVTWFEPYLRGRHEIEALQDRLWGEDNLFALSELPDMSEVRHDFTHGFTLTFPPTDASAAQRGAVVKRIGRLMEKAFPASSDLYVFRNVTFRELKSKISVGVREPGQFNAHGVAQVAAPDGPIFSVGAQVLCEQAFYDHANRNICDLMPAAALLTDAYLQEMEARAARKLDISKGHLTLIEQGYWVSPSALGFGARDYRFRYFEWPD